MKEIHKDLFDSVDKALDGSVSNFEKNLQSGNIRPVMLVIHGIHFTPGERSEIRRFNRNIAWMVFNHFKKYINDQQKDNQNIVTFGGQNLLAVEMPWRNILIGNSMQVKNEIKVAMANRLKLSESGNEVDNALTPPDLKNPSPSYFVNIGKVI